jgi:DNA-binding transcriptional MerR regulator
MVARPTSLASARSSKLFTIGRVLNILELDFPELSPSKLRFLEDQGLVTPQRTDAGYRKFTDGDIDRLRIILELQRDQYLPLKVIRQYLDDLDAGKTPKLPNSAEPKSLRVKQGKKFTELDLIAETAITPALIADAQEVGLLTVEPFSVADVNIARAVVQLQRFGIAPRHLRGLKAAADREIGIIEGVVAPVLAKNETGSRSRAAHFAEEIENQFASIRAEIVRSVIGKIDS